MNEPSSSHVLLKQKKQTAIPVRYSSILIPLGILLFVCAALAGPLSALINSFSVFTPRPPCPQLCTPVPEYRRTMDTVLVSLSERERSLRYHAELFDCLPSYTKILLMVPENNAGIIGSQLRKTDYKDRVTLVPYQVPEKQTGTFYLLFPEKDKLLEVNTERTPVRFGSVWAQDLGEPAKHKNGRLMFCISDVYKWFTRCGGSSTGTVTADNAYLGSLDQAGIEVIKTPFAFAGGNILFDNINGNSLVLCGSDVIKTTQTVYKSTIGKTPSRKRIIETIQTFFNADDIVILGTKAAQPASFLFHLDQAVIPLAEGVIGVTRVVGDTPETEIVRQIDMVRAFLADTRTELTGKGYTVVHIDTSINNIVNHQHYVNAIPYINKHTGKKEILVPRFIYNTSPFENKLFKKNVQTYRSLDYHVIQTPTTADRINGGLHCLANVLE